MSGSSLQHRRQKEAGQRRQRCDVNADHALLLCQIGFGKRAVVAKPALLIKQSTSTPSAPTRSNTLWAAPGSLRSSAIVGTVTLRLSSSAADLSVRSLRLTKIGLCSSAAACRASSSPMPLLAPVISVKTDDWLSICVILRQHQDNDKMKFVAAELWD